VVAKRNVVARIAVTSDGTSTSTTSTSLPEVLDTVIVGGGISGLVTAQALASKHAGKVSSFLVTESRDRVGGNITSMQDSNYIWEEGPNSFQPNDAMLEAAVDAGVADQLVFGDPTAPRFVFWDKKLRATPSGPDALTFDLLSIWGKIRAGLGAVGIMNGQMPSEWLALEQRRGAAGQQLAVQAGGTAGTADATRS
jgi:oxygen-dependent protoporphyrinogen oxidase